ncbi:hypothetical protein [Sporomusa sp. KB1]|uniref:hypothetical protein n=1 Tax=Sporomusa sp. KB1 TaxID=943346 RepID=UPI0011A6DE9E|nr:hypothetical protein [Sporomusa sp. KB1]
MNINKNVSWRCCLGGDAGLFFLSTLANSRETRQPVKLGRSMVYECAVQSFALYMPEEVAT